MSTKGLERAAARYAEQQAEALELLKQIRAGLEQHKREAKKGRGINYGHVGDMGHYLEELREVRDSLHHIGEYAPENEYRGTAFNRHGRKVSVVVPGGKR